MDKSVVLKTKSLDSFFSALKNTGTVYAPVRVSSKSFSFKEVERIEEIAWEAIRTILPPKKFFFTRQETLMRFNSEGFEEVEPELEPFVLFGVHPCDLAGLGILDQIYEDAPADPHYMKRREKALIVGLSCMPDKHCFCKAMGTDTPDRGYDIFLTKIEEGFFIQIKTARGGAFVESHPDLFGETQDRHKSDYNDFWDKRDAAFTAEFDGSNLKSTMDLEWDNKIWEELGNRCLSCGNCTPVCPTCYCFDVYDLPSLHDGDGERVREWDSCQFVGFAKVAGPHNFRPGPVDRLKFWYRHKLHGFDDAAEIPTCVGCGRCTESCPSGIDDIVNVVLRLQGKPSILISDPKKESAGDKTGGEA